MTNLALFQISQAVIYAALCVISYFAVKVFFALPVKRLQPLYDVLLVFVIFSYLLAFFVNF